MIQFDIARILSAVFVLRCKRVNTQGILVLQERNQGVRSLFLFCDDICSVVHNFHCSENFLMTFKNVDLICFTCWCEFKGDMCGLFIIFEYNINAVFNFSRESIIMLHSVRWVEINENFLTFAFFSFFSFFLFRFLNRLFGNCYV